MFHFERVRTLPSLFYGEKFITFIGAGGKTSFIEFLAKCLLKEGLFPVITTTTKIYAKEPFLVEEKLTDGLMKDKPFIRVGGRIVDGKLDGVKESTLLELGRFYDMVLIEGDGSKGKPLKYPSYHEPVIPQITDLVVLVSGLDGMYKRVDEVVFRWELLNEKEGIRGEEKIDEGRFAALVSGPMLKGIDGKRYVICLNKYDLQRDVKGLERLLAMLLERTHPQFLLVSSFKYGIFYRCEKL